MYNSHILGKENESIVIYSCCKIIVNRNYAGGQWFNKLAKFYNYRHKVHNRLTGFLLSYRKCLVKINNKNMHSKYEGQFRSNQMLSPINFKPALSVELIAFLTQQQRCTDKRYLQNFNQKLELSIITRFSRISDPAFANTSDVISEDLPQVFVFYVSLSNEQILFDNVSKIICINYENKQKNLN